LFAYEKVDLIVEEAAIDYMVDKAMEFKLGGRGLRSICELVLTDAMYETPSDDSIQTLTIDEAYVQEKLSSNKINFLKSA
jgi:ATP-dependent Clp protease ATP-binding subunit ClpX